MSKSYTNIRLLAVMAILSVALPGAFALKTTNLYLAEGSSAILMDYSYTDGDFGNAKHPVTSDNIVELKITPMCTYSCSRSRDHHRHPEDDS